MADTVKTPADPLDSLANQAELQAAEAIAADPGAPGEEGSNENPPISNSQAVAGAIAAGREAFCFFTKLQSPRRVLPDERVGQLAALADPVLTKHGIQLGDYLGDIGAEIALAVALFAVVAEMRTAVAAEIEAKKPKDAPGPEIVETVNDGPSI